MVSTKRERAEGGEGGYHALINCRHGQSITRGSAAKEGGKGMRRGIYPTTKGKREVGLTQTVQTSAVLEERK